MLCENCKQNPATVHMAEISQSNLKKETHLCEACASKKGVTYNVKMSIEELLGGLLKAQMGAGAAGTEPGVRCPDCGMTLQEFASRARFGCPRDYEVFQAGDHLIKLLDRVHGKTRHIGKTPGTSARVGEHIVRLGELRRLEQELNRLVEQEQYEKAAAVRDRIKQLRTSMDADKT